MRTPYDAEWRAVRLAVMERDGWRCQLVLAGCTGAAEQVDHIVPLSEGGVRLDPFNLRASCAPCNQRRNRERQAELARHARELHVDRRPSREW
jgi:5-methylcytosine-specific restriction endonuclease McrA